MKYYPCILLTRTELYENGVPQLVFENGRMTDKQAWKAVEDYCGHPIVSIRESARDTDELLILIADGYIQYNRLTNRRTVVLIGQRDNLQTILQDIFAEHPDEDPYDIFQSYAYQTDINVQLDLQNWVRNEYTRF